MENLPKGAIGLYIFGGGLEEKEMARLLSVSVKTASNYVSGIKSIAEEEKNKKIFDVWLSCRTLE